MAATNPNISDPLLALRGALGSSTSSVGPVLTTSAEPAPILETTDLVEATHLFLPDPPQSIPLSTPTRFVSAAANQTIDLRSIYFAWLKRDVTIPEYIASAQELNDSLSQKDGSGATKVLNLVFVERLDLITWLEGASEESEYIKPLPAAAGGTVAQAAQDSAGVASGAAGGVPTVPSGKGAMGGAGAGGRTVKVIDPRLQEIYNGERKMGDRNSVLRGVKPTDFSHVRKTAEMFLGRNRSRPGAVKPGMKPPAPTAGLKPPSPSSARRQIIPIILVSPSASSLLRMSNIKTFLSDGYYIPPDHHSLSKSTGSNLLQVQRTLRTVPDASQSSALAAGRPVNPNAQRKPTMFILVDSTADFKPDYWNRVVAVFTTGQTWQFKSYKWSSPPELFKHATGIYVGWRGDDVPREVKGWGRGVRTFAIDRWDEKSAMAPGAGGTGGTGRWRDRGVVEDIWATIEEGMRSKGWGTVK